MKEKLKKIINHYGIDKQLKYFQLEVFELNEAIIEANMQDKISITTMEQINHIAEEIADVAVMLKQFQIYYDIDPETITNIADKKIERQLDRIDNETKEESK